VVSVGSVAPICGGKSGSAGNRLVLEKGNVMYEWLEIQWHRFNIWLEAKRQNPGWRVWVKYEGQGRFRVMKGWFGKPPKNYEEEKKRWAEEGERRRRLRAFKGKEK